jgi:hypothetical protein
LSQGRRVRRVVRKVDVWTVLRFSALLYLSLFIVLLVTGVLLWLAAALTGVTDNAQDFIAETFALESFRFAGRQLLTSTVLSGLILVLVGTGLNTLIAVLYNLITEVFGGVEVTVIEPESGQESVV